MLLAFASASRHTSLEARVLPYLADLPQTPQLSPSTGGTSAFAGVFGPVVRRGAGLLEKVLGGSDSIRRRIVRAGLPMTVHDFRVQQVLWGLVGFATAAVPAALLALARPRSAVPLLICCLCAAAAGVLMREQWLTHQVQQRERQILEEFPVVAELLALSVAAGEAPLAALDRVTRCCQGALAEDLRSMLAAVRTGTPLATAFDEMGARSGLPVVSRFAEAMAIAIERGTPLADVLHAQAGDVREASRRQLIETGARKEVAMMIPVVFIVLPVVVVFAFFPGLVGLRLVV